MRARITALLLDLRPEVIRQAQAQRDECQSWIRRAGGWVHGGTGHVEISDSVHAAVRVHDSLLWIGVHACRAHVMPPSAKE